jgi:hypothetical protein
MKPPLSALLPRPAHASRDGGAIRMHHLLAALVPAFRVRAFVLSAAGGASGEFPSGVDVVEIPHRAGPWRRAAAAGAGILGGAYPERIYRSSALEEALARAVAANGRPGSWRSLITWVSAALRSGAPAWIDFQNLDSEIWRRLGETASRAAVRAFARNQSPRVEALERRLVREAGGISCVSMRDARALEAFSPRDGAADGAQRGRSVALRVPGGAGGGRAPLLRGRPLLAAERRGDPMVPRPGVAARPESAARGTRRDPRPRGAARSPRRVATKAFGSWARARTRGRTGSTPPSRSCRSSPAAGRA